MYVSQGSNEYHHLTVKSIREQESKSGTECTILICDGKTFNRNTKSSTGHMITPYEIRVYVLGMLRNYVEAEIDIGNNIFVIGRSAVRTRKQGTSFWSQRVLEAECIYKEDWMRYYPNSNPMDFE